MVKYNLEIGKDCALITPELKDKFPKMVDVSAEGKLLKKVAKQRAVYVYVDEQGKEQSPAGKGIVRDGDLVSLNKVENLKAFQMKKVPKTEMFNYSIQGTYKILRTSLELKENEAITFVWALSKGYLNTVRGFIYRNGKDYLLIKTSLGTLEQLGNSYIVEKEEVKEQKVTVNPLEQMKALGIEA